MTSTTAAPEAYLENAARTREFLQEIFGGWASNIHDGGRLFWTVECQVAGHRAQTSGGRGLKPGGKGGKGGGEGRKEGREGGREGRKDGWMEQFRPP